MSTRENLWKEAGIVPNLMGPVVTFDQADKMEGAKGKEKIREMISRIGPNDLKVLLDDALKILGESLQADPLTKEFAHWCQSDMATQLKKDPDCTPTYIISTPEQVIGERNLFCNAITETAFHSDEIQEKQTALAFLSPALSGVPILITRELWNAAQNLKVPDHLISKTMLPFPYIWFAISDDGFKLYSGTDDKAEVISIVLQHTAIGVRVFTLSASPKLERMNIIVDTWKYGDKYPDDLLMKCGGNLQHMWSVEVFLALLSLITSPHIQHVERPLSRGTRKRREKALKKVKSNAAFTHPSVHEVKLFSQARTSDGSAHTGEQMEHDFRWMVRGHIRNQYFSKADEHKLIWIAPFIKGPDDKPLRTNVYD